MQVEQAGLNRAKARLIAERVDLIVGVLKVGKGIGWLSHGRQDLLSCSDRTDTAIALLFRNYSAAFINQQLFVCSDDTRAALHVSTNQLDYARAWDCIYTP
jgi:hypothetical protein